MCASDKELCVDGTSKTKPLAFLFLFFVLFHAHVSQVVSTLCLSDTLISVTTHVRDILEPQVKFSQRLWGEDSVVHVVDRGQGLGVWHGGVRATTSLSIHFASRSLTVLSLLATLTLFALQTHFTRSL